MHGVDPDAGEGGMGLTVLPVEAGAALPSLPRGRRPSPLALPELGKMLSAIAAHPAILPLQSRVPRGYDRAARGYRGVEEIRGSCRADELNSVSVEATRARWNTLCTRQASLHPISDEVVRLIERETGRPLAHVPPGATS